MKSKIILEKPNHILLPLQKVILKGRITSKGLIVWDVGSAWRLGNAINKSLQNIDHYIFSDIIFSIQLPIIKPFLLCYTADQKLAPPFCYEKHVHFLDTTEFNATNPIYINMVRHPIKRVISWYYYVRSSRYLYAKSDHWMPRLKQMKVTYEDCVLKKREECSYPIGKQEFKTNLKSYIPRLPQYSNSLVM